ncbi:MAG: lipopolysaccharide biosynthesis protein [Acidimicrobiales bacterium]
MAADPQNPNSQGWISRQLAKAGPALVNRAGWSLVVELLQLASSTLVFLILVKFMTQDTFGELGSLLALVFPALSVGSIGSHFLLLRRSSQGEELAEAWNRAITVGFIGPLAAAGLMIVLRPVLLPNVDAWAYVLVFVGNLPFYWLNELAVYLGVGSGRMKQAAQVRAILVFFRFLALAWFALWGDGGLTDWAMASTLSFAAGGLGAVFFVSRVFGLRPRFVRGVHTDLRPGMPFSVNSANESLVDASDRWLLGRFDHKADAALYTLGARIIQFGYLPLRILLRAYDAEMFAAGKYGIRSVLPVTRRMIKPGMGVAVAVGLGFLLLAPAVPWIAGPEYEESVEVIRFLAILPMIRMVQYLAGNTLSAADRQPWRMVAAGLAMVVNLSLNLWLLRDGDWRVAVYTTFFSEVLLAGMLIALVAYGSRAELHKAQARS